MKEEEKIRELVFTNEFNDFYNSANEKVKSKIDFIIHIIETKKIIIEKYVKKLENTDFYEMRISVSSNEYRTILFSINAENLIEATQVLFLNSFLKKDTKDYKKALKEAVNLLYKTLNKDEELNDR